MLTQPHFTVLENISVEKPADAHKLPEILQLIPVCLFCCKIAKIAKQKKSAQEKNPLNNQI